MAAKDEHVPTLEEIRAAREYAEGLAMKRLDWLFSDAVKIVDESGKVIA
jgi:hypothetical protein